MRRCKGENSSHPGHFDRHPGESLPRTPIRGRDPGALILRGKPQCHHCAYCRAAKYAGRMYPESQRRFVQLMTAPPGFRLPPE
jgi:hypothetical protein